MASNLIYDIRDCIQSDINIIWRCLRSFHCHSVTSRASLKTESRNWLSSLVVQSESATALCCVPADSSSRSFDVRCDAHRPLDDIFELTEPPCLRPIPASRDCVATTFPQFKWIFCVMLQVVKQDDGITHMSLEITSINSQNANKCGWITPSVAVNLANIGKPLSINLVAFTTLDFLYSGNTEIHLCAQVCVHYGTGQIHHFKFGQPVRISLNDLLFQLNSSSFIVTDKLLSSVDPRLFYPHSRKWRVSSCRTTTSRSLLKSFSDFLEPIVGFSLITVKHWREHPFFWVTCGPFSGMAINIRPTDDSVLEVDVCSCSPFLLDLFTRAICGHHASIRFDLAESVKRSEHFVMSSAFTDLLECVLDEIQCLLDQLRQFIKTTMCSRVPQLNEFLPLTDEVHLTTAYRVSQWRDLVCQAHLLPIEYPNPSQPYTERSRMTNVSLHHFCDGGYTLPNANLIDHV